MVKRSNNNKIILIISVLLCFLIFLYYLLFIWRSYKENLDSPTLNPPFIQLSLKNTKKGISGPNPNGFYNVFYGSSAIPFQSKSIDVSLNNVYYIPYVQDDNSFNLIIKPNKTKSDEKNHYADIFPEKFLLDINIQNRINKFYSINDGITTDPSIYIDAAGNLNITHLGIIRDTSKDSVGYVKSDTFNKNHFMITVNKFANIQNIAIRFYPAPT